ncbi:MAG: DUF3303 family protein [Phycisphaerales bacterium]|nr:DUF3303 family protein [Phycisphaerales bacterium]MCB9841191.1 DUF3303 family protein [Phycisphaeraceae bacterium]
MLFMVIEHFEDGRAAEVYRRFRERGRMAPDDVRYVASWVDTDFRRCFQVMEAPSRASLQAWMDAWSDLVRFDVAEVRTSAQAAAIMDADA